MKRKHSLGKDNVVPPEAMLEKRIKHMTVHEIIHSHKVDSVTCIGVLKPLSIFQPDIEGTCLDTIWERLNGETKDRLREAFK